MEDQTPLLKSPKVGKNYILVIVILAVIVGTVFFIWQYSWQVEDVPIFQVFTYSNCGTRYGVIEKEFENSNFCEVDKDCKAVTLGGAYIEFGCYKFVNKSIDENTLLKKVEAYSKKCSQVIDECAATPRASCISKKCVPVIE